MDNDDSWVSAVSVKLLSCLLRLQDVRTFNSKELGDCKLMQPWDVTISTNAGYAPGWHHRCQSLHQGSFSLTSLLVPASTCRYAVIRDMCMHAHRTSRSTYPVRAQLADTAVGASSGPPQNLQGPPALHPAHSSTLLPDNHLALCNMLSIYSNKSHRGGHSI